MRSHLGAALRGATVRLVDPPSRELGGASSIALLTVGAAIAWIAAFIILSVLGTLVSGLLAALLTGVGQGETVPATQGTRSGRRCDNRGSSIFLLPRAPPEPTALENRHEPNSPSPAATPGAASSVRHTRWLAAIIGGLFLLLVAGFIAMVVFVRTRSASTRWGRSPPHRARAGRAAFPGHAQRLGAAGPHGHRCPAAGTLRARHAGPQRPARTA